MARKGGLWQSLRSWLPFRFSLHPAPEAPSYAQYADDFRLTAKVPRYSPENLPHKDFRDLSSIYYWKRATGGSKRTSPVPRKPDVLKSLEKQPPKDTAEEDILTMKLLGPPVSVRKFKDVPVEEWA